MFGKDNYFTILDKYSANAQDIVDVYALEPDFYSILRHDVEFSLERAHKVSLWDNEKNFPSSILVQVYSDAYNIFSVTSQNILRAIDNLEYCTIGLHLYVSHIKENDWEGLYREINLQSKILSDCMQRPIDRFSIHRPPEWTLRNRDDVICGMLNFYGGSFFEFHPKPKQIKYLADSQHCFKYGNPLDDFEHKKYQLLLHPDEWTDFGEDTNANFNSLMNEHAQRFVSCLKSETNHYTKVFE